MKHVGNTVLASTVFVKVTEESRDFPIVPLAASLPHLFRGRGQGSGDRDEIITREKLRVHFLEKYLRNLISMIPNTFSAH